MSAGNGNGRIAKYHKQVSEEAGCQNGDLLPYAPDWLDSLVCRMANTADMVEVTFAWMLYRASGNQSKRAVHVYGVKDGHGHISVIETGLLQRDCGLELAWLKAGHRPEWLDAPITIFREEANRREIRPIEKSLVSDGFTGNRKRGTVASGTGHSLELVPSPKVGDSTNFPSESKAKTTTYQDYCARWKVAHSREFEEEQVARSIIERNNKLRLSGYRSERKSGAPATNGAPFVETVETVEVIEAVPAPAPPPLPPPSSPVLEVILDSPSSSSSSAFVPCEEKAEEEDPRSPYQIFKAEYPADHFDEPRTKPFFERKTKAEQARILERLRVYRDSPRWKDEGGRWIPLSGKWLETYDLDPPSVVRRKSNGSATRDALEAFMAGEG